MRCKYGNSREVACAAQEQASRINSRNIGKSADFPLCRLCDEKLQPMMRVCPKLAQKEYKRTHGKVAKIIHWKLCVEYNLERKDRWYDRH